MVETTPARAYQDYDVVVVGHGVSGLSTAIAAHEAGATPVILEKAPREKRGGHTQFAGGIFRFPMADPEAIADELDLDRIPERYTEEDFYDDLMEVSEGQADHDLCSTFVENATDAVRWISEYGVDWHVVDHSEEPGFGTTVGGLQVDGEGAGVIEALSAHIEETGIDVHYDTEFVGLLTDDTRSVAGAAAVNDDGKVRYEAPSVVVAAGSYVANDEKRVRYFGEDGDDYIVRGTRYNTGEAIDAAMDAGAKPDGEWGGAHRVLNDIEAPDVEGGRTRINGYQYGVILNKNGERFVDEGEDFLLKTYAKFGKRVHDQPDQQAYVVFDAQVDDYVVSQLGTDPTQATSLRELFETLDVDDVDAAVSTVEAYNAACDPGAFDPHALDGNATSGLEIDKSNWALPIEKPPYYCFPVASAITFAFGGLKITTEAEVLDRREKPIEGLWAVGNSTAEFFYENYPGGSALTRGATFGRIAGENAAAHARATREVRADGG
ncbi:MAG: FAD-dependent tricarballylate dehydrogenase TcuA [Salinirussus sp.]